MLFGRQIGAHLGPFGRPKVMSHNALFETPLSVIQNDTKMIPARFCCAPKLSPELNFDLRDGPEKHFGAFPAQPHPLKSAFPDLRDGPEKHFGVFPAQPGPFLLGEWSGCYHSPKRNGSPSPIWHQQCVKGHPKRSFGRPSYP